MFQCYSIKAASAKSDWWGESKGLEHWEIGKFELVSDFDIRI